MSDYQSKISSLQNKINLLKEKELVLVQKRKKLIGDLGERFNMLSFSDECLAGLLNDCSKMLATHPQKVGEYEEKGKKIFGKKQRCPETKTDSKSLGSSNSDEATTK